MKFAGLCLVFVSALAWAHQKPVKTDKTADRLVAFCQKKTPNVDPEYLRYVTGETIRLVQLAKQSDKHLKDLNEHTAVEWLLAAYYVESRYDQKANGDGGKSFGISQTRLKCRKKLLEYWHENGQEIEGTIEDPTTQVAFGVAEFSMCWYWARGAEHNMRYWETLRRYNGSGWKARRHANRVLKCRNEIFRRG